MEGCILFFAHELLESMMPMINATKSDEVRAEANTLLHACTLLREWFSIVLNNGWVISPARCRRALHCLKGHNALMRSLGSSTRLAPKHHAAFDMTRRMHLTGNPRFFACYPDESLNRFYAESAAVAHPSVVAISVLKRDRLHKIVHGRTL